MACARVWSFAEAEVAAAQVSPAWPEVTQTPTSRPCRGALLCKVISPRRALPRDKNCPLNPTTSSSGWETNADSCFAVTQVQGDVQKSSGVGGHQGPSGPPAEPMWTSENHREVANVSAEDQAEPTARE